MGKRETQYRTGKSDGRLDSQLAGNSGRFVGGAEHSDVALGPKARLTVLPPPGRAACVAYSSGSHEEKGGLTLVF